MPLEVEAKIALTPEADRTLRSRLAALHPAGPQRRHERNVYLDTPDAALRRAGCGLRVRRHRDLDTATAAVVVTHKGPVRPGPLKARDEHEFNAASFDDTLALFGALGYSPTLAFDKRRDRYRLGGVLVECDRLPYLGCFVEIEAPDAAAVQQARERLGLADRELIAAGYPELLAAHLAAHPALDPHQLTLSDREDPAV